MKIDRSQLRPPSFETSGRRVPTLPKVNAAGWLKTLVLNQRSRRSWRSPSSRALVPLLLARMVWLKMLARFEALIESGLPVW